VKKRPPPIDAPAGPFNAAFAALKDRQPASERAAPPAGPPAPRTKPTRPPPGRAVVRIERKGRGGKEATVIEKLGLAPAALAEWSDALKRALGCGGTVEGDAVVVQGDQRERVRRWLEERGVGKVTVA
jgi:translation initiation factor 1